MSASAARSLPADLASELERKFFWWEPVGEQPRSDFRILAQVMSLASFEDVRRLETALGAQGWPTGAAIRACEFRRSGLNTGTEKP
jgi:hypothetical protein